jgi:hypothetical protein
LSKLIQCSPNFCRFQFPPLVNFFGGHALFFSHAGWHHNYRLHATIRSCMSDTSITADIDNSILDSLRFILDTIWFSSKTQNVTFFAYNAMFS